MVLRLPNEVEPIRCRWDAGYFAAEMTKDLTLELNSQSELNPPARFRNDKSILNHADTRILAS